MADDVPDTNENPAEPTPVTAPPSAPPARRRRVVKWVLIAVAVVLVAPALLFTIWSGIALKWTYSEGDRAGFVQKFSKKGWVCKTWEGELALANFPGSVQERWFFTVRNDSVASAINALMGQRVSLHYQEHPGVPSSCFGETRYHVTGVRQVAGP